MPQVNYSTLKFSLNQTTHKTRILTKDRLWSSVAMREHLTILMSAVLITAAVDITQPYLYNEKHWVGGDHGKIF